MSVFTRWSDVVVQEPVPPGLKGVPDTRKSPDISNVIVGFVVLMPTAPLLLINNAPLIDGSGGFPEVSGHSEEVGKISKAIRGERGYYVCQVTNATKADMSKFATDRDAITKQVASEMKQSAFYKWFSAVRDHADIEDNRIKIYNRQ